MFRSFLQGALELIFPDNCLLCRQFLNSRHQRQLCPQCLDTLSLNPTPFSRQNQNGPGHSFLSDQVRSTFDAAWSVCLYNEPAQKLLHAFKYNSKTSLHKTFVPLMIDFIDRYHIPLQEFDLISPIPLHPVRLRERGYNQSALLSLALSKHYGVPHTENLLIRQKNTHTQTELGAKQRWTNMEGAFRIKNPSDVTGRTIILIDDLFTTGATLQSAAETLKAAGAARVCVLTLSMTV